MTPKTESPDDMSAMDELRAYIAGAYAAGLPEIACQSILNFAAEISSEAASVAVAEVRGALETVAQWDEWAADWLVTHPALIASERKP